MSTQIADQRPDEWADARNRDTVVERVLARAIRRLEAERDVGPGQVLARTPVAADDLDAR